MGKLAVVLAATALVAAPTAGAAAADATPARATKGEFSAPIREDDFRRGGEVKSIDNPSCYTEGTRKTCLPSGASQNVLPDGRILYWNAIEGGEDVNGPVATEGHRRAGDARSRLLTLGSTNSWKIPANETGFFAGTPEKPLVAGTKVEERGDTANDGSLFCADNTFLPNGDVLTVGGTDYYAEPGVHPSGQSSIGVLELEGLKSARSFTAKGDTWKQEGSMVYGRWYPSLTTLADGKVLASSGVTKLLKPAYAPDSRYGVQDSGRNVAQSEVFDPATSEWSVNKGEFADRSLPLFPRMHLLPNGHVYYDAAGQAFNPAGQGYDEALWNRAASYDPVSKSWTELGIPGLTTGRDKMVDAGFRGSTFSQMLNLKAPYNTASFLSAGGVVGTSPGSYVPVSSTRINRWSAPKSAKDSEKLDTFEAGPLAGRRWYGSGVTLPDGSVIVLSGGDLDHVVAPGTETPITRVERFTPTTDPKNDREGGKWETLAEAKFGRTYHNAATLLPDGRVLVGGHDPIPTLYGPPDDRIANSDANPNASFEIFSPPYLFDKTTGDAAPRPIINADSQVQLGKQLTLGTSGANEIDKVVLVRNPSVTHLIDGDQRNVELLFKQTGSSVRADVPANSAVLPPGPYLLFAVNTSGTPSVAQQVFVGADGTPAVTPTAASPGGGPTVATKSQAAPKKPAVTRQKRATSRKKLTPSRNHARPSSRKASARVRPTTAKSVRLAAVPASNHRPLPRETEPLVAIVAGLALAFVGRRSWQMSVGGRRR